FACGASSGFYRVSEYDCANESTSTGSGSTSDPVYIRATFSRDTTYLGAYENILAVVEYSSAYLDPAPANPSACVSGGVFDPTNTNCSDFSWQAFLKHGISEIVQP